MATFKEYTTKKGSFWQVRGYLGTDDLTGEKVEYRKRGFDTKKEAQASYARALNDFLTGNVVKKDINITYEQVYHEWLEQYRLTVKESTLNTVISIFKSYIIPSLGSYRISKITHVHLQKFVNSLHEEYGNYKYYYRYACKIFDYAIMVGYIDDSPKKRVQVPKKKQEYKHAPKRDKEFYTKEELERFFELFKNEDNPLWFTYFRILAFTGIRKGEALALTWNDIDFKNQTISINKTLTRGVNNKQVVNDTPKTNSGIRTISIDPRTVEILKEWKVEQSKRMLLFGFNTMNKNQLVFNSLKNKHLCVSHPRYVLKSFCDKHDFPFINIHGFRHTHCSLLFESGVPLKDVKERLGHSDIQTTMNIYTHVTQASRDKSAQLFANYVNF